MFDIFFWVRGHAPFRLFYVCVFEMPSLTFLEQYWTAYHAALPKKIQMKDLVQIGHFTKYSNHIHVNPNESKRILKI